MRRTATRFSLAASLIMAAAWPGVAFAASTVSGTITYTGTVPTMKPLAMDADPACAKKHAGKPPVSETLVLGGGNAIGNVLVFVSKGVPAGKTYPAPQKPVTLDQNGCMYVPHVQGIMVGQSYRILNSDGVLHNVHSLPSVNPQFNKPMPPTMKETTTTFAKPEPVFRIKCDVHPWMVAYIGVFTHPFYSVTAKDGKFSITGLEAGTYEITAWHEALGMQTASITVGASDTKTQDFKFDRPAAKK